MVSIQMQCKQQDEKQLPLALRLGFRGRRSSMDRMGFNEEPSHEASVYAHGLHGAGFHDVVQGHIPSRQGSLKITRETHWAVSAVETHTEENKHKHHS